MKLYFNTQVMHVPKHCFLYIIVIFPCLVRWLKMVLAVCSFIPLQYVSIYYYQNWCCGNLLMLRLLKTHLANQSMHLSSTSRTFSAHPPRISSIPCMTLTVKVQISSVDIHLVSVRVPKLQSLMASGSTSLIMTHLHSLWSLGRGTLGWQFVL